MDGATIHCSRDIFDYLRFFGLIKKSFKRFYKENKTKDLNIKLQYAWNLSALWISTKRKIHALEANVQ
ncbi:hypothetical protein THRCLA_22911 [Thraustotheca clavata]|uniref:Uncharacterized protein n=1 Tax=Thraustotheca clavata TaxID=74557 RepID=A0A1V9YPL6_9STRA|nr:hypothetical protein THRCLA_22911 [Thraustotheca clavata]